jgi:hypothetical protein
VDRNTSQLPLLLAHRASTAAFRCVCKYPSSLAIADVEIAPSTGGARAGAYFTINSLSLRCEEKHEGNKNDKSKILLPRMKSEVNY